MVNNREKTCIQDMNSLGNRRSFVTTIKICLHRREMSYFRILANNCFSFLLIVIHASRIFLFFDYDELAFS